MEEVHKKHMISLEKLYNYHFLNNGIIYTSNLEKYKQIKENYNFLFKIICENREEIVQYLKETFEIIKYYNKNYYINPIINNLTYEDVYYPLHKELCKYYGDEQETSFSLNYDFIEN